MHVSVAALVLTAVLAVSDPAAKHKDVKELNSFLSSELAELSEGQIAALGSENKEVCKLILSRHIGQKQSQKDLFRQKVSLECAMQMAQANPEALNRVFEGLEYTHARNFATNRGQVEVCRNKEAFAKITKGDFYKHLTTFCEQPEVKKAVEEAIAADERAKSAAAATGRKRGNSAGLVQASVGAVLSGCLLAGLLL